VAFFFGPQTPTLGDVSKCVKVLAFKLSEKIVDMVTASMLFLPFRAEKFGHHLVTPHVTAKNVIGDPAPKTEIFSPMYAVVSTRNFG
jgi:acyl-CoA reductase-like NAD-dependent aldehyde dehydrogenase